MPFHPGAVSGSSRRRCNVVLVLLLLALPVPSRALAGRPVRSTWRSYSSGRVFAGHGGVAHRARAGAAGGIAEMRSNEVRLEETELWLDEIGVDRCGGGTGTPTAKLRRFGGRGIGLEAIVELERDSTVASIPRRVCLSSDAKDAPAGTLRAWAHDLVASIPRFSEGALALETDVAVVTLQVFLERAAGGRSAFAPWMAALPEGRDDLNLPALWPAIDREALEGTLVLRDVEGCLARAETERDAVAAAIWDRLGEGDGLGGRECRWLDPEGMEGRPTLEEWLHARCAVQSRAYRVGRRYLLIPLVDFANHDDDVAFAVCPGDGVFTGQDEVVLVADRSYRPGQEFCTSYGDMDNAKRLFSFGFVTLARPPARRPGSSSADALALPTEAFCDLTFDLASTDPLRAFKEAVLRERGGEVEVSSSSLSVSALFPLTPDRPYVSQLVEGPARSFVDSSVMPVLRLVALTLEEFRSEGALGDLCQPGHEEPMCSPGSENGLESSAVSRRGDAVPVLAAGKGGSVLDRLGSRFSLKNEREALRLLEGRCSSRLRAIGLTLRDAEALREAVGGPNEAGTFAASAPRALLCAAVRVGEAIAWDAILETSAIGSTDGGAREQREGQTWASWVSERCGKSSGYL